jgi:hypothetical protein
MKKFGEDPPDFSGVRPLVKELEHILSYFHVSPPGDLDLDPMTPKIVDGQTHRQNDYYREPTSSDAGGPNNS